jgi:membrane protein DedA with SNARE-associated domain/rhodanese-related sulfurtransferase
MRTLIELLLNHGIQLLFIVTLAARVGIPVPAAPFLVVAGGLAASGHVSGLAAFMAAIVANLLGDAVWFQAGRTYGHRVLRLLCRVSLSPDSCVRQSESLISRWGGSSLIAAKFLPGISVVAAPMAGALGMSTLRFLGFDLLAGALWSGVFLALGLLLSDQIQQTLDALLLRRYVRRSRFLRNAGSARITVDEARALIERGVQPTFVDVRAEASRTVDPRRIAGALLLDDLKDRQSQRPELHPDSELVLYCNCPNEVSALVAAETLSRQGFTRVRALTGGLDAWAAAGHPIAGG